MRTVSLSNLSEMRNLDECADDDAVLLINNCSSHAGAVILNLLRDDSVHALTWQSDTTQIFQELNISLFGVLKRRVQYQLLFDDDEGTTAFILKTYRTLKQTMVETNTLGVFHEAGFEFDVEVEPYRIRADAEKIEKKSGVPKHLGTGFPF
jgi:hypothetical protein